MKHFCLPDCRLLAAVVAFLVMAMTSLASGAGLTEHEVARYIEVTRELQGMENQFRVFEELREEEMASDPVSPERMQTLLADSVSFMRERDTTTYRLLEQRVRKHGFSSAEAYGQLGDRILLAFFSLEMNRSRQKLDQEMQSVLAEVEASEFFSEAQKEDMRAMIARSRARLETAYPAPEADKPAVQAHLPALQELLGFAETTRR